MQSGFKRIITVNTTFYLGTVYKCLFRHISKDVVYIQASIIIKSKNTRLILMCQIFDSLVLLHREEKAPVVWPH
jgi:hypothetical protein